MAYRRGHLSTEQLDVVLENSKVLVDFIEVVDFNFEVVFAIDKLASKLFTLLDFPSAEFAI